MTTLREAAQQALEALSEYEKSYPAVADAFKPLRTALAEPTSQESRQVEPVAYMSMCCSKGQTKPHSKTLFWPEQYTGRTEPVDAGAWGEERVVPLYTAPPKRNPMTEQQLDEMFDQAEISIYIADRQQKEHLEVYSFGVRDAEKWHGIGGEE